MKLDCTELYCVYNYRGACAGSDNRCLLRNDRCEICGAIKARHKQDHLCRMHKDVFGTCTICGKVKS